MLKYFLAVGRETPSPKTFRHDLCEVFDLDNGLKAKLYISGEAYESDNFYEGFVRGRVVVQLISPNACQTAQLMYHAVDLTETLKKVNGFFAGIVLGEHVMVFRDHVGLAPVYLVENEVKIVTNLPAEAAEWAAAPKPVKPATATDIIASRPYSFWHPSVTEDASESLLERLTSSVKKLCPKNPAVFFSGGLDSLVLAKLLDQLGYNPVLLTLGVEGSRDFERSERAAKTLGLNVVRVNVDRDMVGNALEKLKRLLGKMSVMDASIATAMYLLSVEAVEMGCSAAVSGQGADELFAGYRRYETVLAAEGYKGLDEVLRRDFLKLHEFGLPRDFLAARAGGTYVITPYLAKEVVEAAVSIPSSKKIAVEEGGAIRKKVLREVCRQLGLGELAEVEKKALQYSTGLQKIVRKMV
ncbi:MAG: asparagine synthase-related protein [Candidatus Caldarchaeum sp.]